MKNTDQTSPDDLSRLQDSIDSLQSRIEHLEAKMVALETSPLRRYLAATISGLAATASVYLLTLLLRKRFSGQVNRIHTGILMLLYYISLRLHFFTDDPLIASLPLSLFILAIPVVIQFVYALRRNSQFLTGIFNDTNAMKKRLDKEKWPLIHTLKIL
jgi:hypothetical protein